MTDRSSRDEGPGKAALDKIDAVVAARPHKDDYVLSDATEDLCRFRDDLIAAVRAAPTDPEASERLAQLNGVVSVVLGTHFPLGETPWDALTAARAGLAALLAQTEPT